MISFAPRLGVALGFLVLGLSAPARGQPYGCPPYQPPQVTVMPYATTARYDDTQSLAQIAQMSQRAGVAVGAREMRVGLTAASLRIESAFTTASRQMPNDPMVCSQISRFELRFGFDDLTVFLARELPRHSCGYQVVLGHENKHVATDQRILAAYLPQLPQLLTQTLRQTGVLRTGSSEAAQLRFRVLLDAYVQQLTASIEAVRRQQQQQIDTPEEYRRITQSCGGDIARLAQQAGG